MIVYLATNTVNGMQYVGVTTRELDSRIKEHFKYAQRKKRGEGSFANAIRDYGEDKIIFKVIEKVKSIDELSKAERKWIDELNTIAPNGYNKKKGGITEPGANRTNRTFEIEGKKFNSLMSLAKAYGIGHHTLRFRLYKSVEPWSLKQALGLEEPPVHKKVNTFKKLMVSGKEYESQSAACREYSVKVKKYRQRILKGWSVEEALEIIERVSPYSIESNNNHPNPLAKAINLENNMYKSVTQAATKYGIDPQRVYQRLKYGWSVEEAFELKDRPKKRKGISFSGYSSIAEAAKENKINVTTLHQRIRKGWSQENALKTPLIANDGSRRKYS